MAAGRDELERLFLPKEALAELFRALHDDGYTVIAPARADGVVSLRPITSVTSIARGVRDEQGPGKYRIEEGDGQLLFDYVVGADSPKRYLFPPRQQLFALKVGADRLEVEEWPAEPPKYAFLGVRPCELAAVRVQDRVFGADAGKHAKRCESEAYYRRAREQALFIVVNCSRPGGTCFCASMGTGPAAVDGFDIAMTELTKGFVLRIGSELGHELLLKLSVRSPSAAEMELEDLKIERARERMGRVLERDEVARQALNETLGSPRWREVAKRCMSCGNCTMVCPTCFCSTVTDESDLSAEHVTRTRHWESCFTHQFSYTTAGPVRNTISARYRHWLRHKLSTWEEQFGTSGCVGCGRCITWCPQGIDITEEANALRAAFVAAGASSGTDGEVF